MAIDLEDRDQVFREIYLPMANDPVAWAAYGAVEFLDQATNDPTKFNGGPENLELWLAKFGSMSKWEMEVAVSGVGITSLKDEQHTALLQRVDALKTKLQEWQSQQAV